MSMTFLENLGINQLKSENVYYSVIGSDLRQTGEGSEFAVTSPINGMEVARFKNATPAQLEQVIITAEEAFKAFCTIPAPLRGELVRRIGNLAREHKEDLAKVITLESGKIMAEALGEVQEWIDVCDFAVGLSRQLHGKTIVSERPGHRMMEQWQPLGPVAVITAFNFPMAVWAWNTMIGLVCGDTMVLKPSEKAPLCALACQAILEKALQSMPNIPRGIFSVIIGDRDIGQLIATDKRFPLVSATGSTRMGRSVGEAVGARLGRSLLELGGNNAMIVTATADLDLALRAIVFSAAGTAGQRCTTLRRLITHTSVKADLIQRLKKSYASLTIGDPTVDGNLVGPLIDQCSFAAMQNALTAAQEQGGEVLFGGERVTVGVPDGGYYVRPAIVSIRHDAPVVHQETFAPILYVLTYTTMTQAIDIQNEVPQGLSSAIFTESMREAELFVSAAGSDCGIANVNIGTSGAEIGGAFGGEKETGGGRESGSDAWKAYMRRTTNTINYGGELPLAQGIVFE
ncbi:aldehyde dehydrogenase family protein [Amphritea sp. 1_MG-2023]|uniref:L-piperidine-6-carboxylate dehydrogenase n=1 Tax=Amphritea sp. 1_MG-2023 TaxID=3062670 RepID=UPI0026E14C6B|nr:aldehyde dehydrogenase family protein [Amphritea sp. 1_MG-2023]MDO6564543.1 aldehyde dehydrogenase family protein [Amphritea sp. 1_MG-2023]